MRHESSDQESNLFLEPVICLLCFLVISKHLGKCVNAHNVHVKNLVKPLYLLGTHPHHNMLMKLIQAERTLLFLLP